MVVKNRLSDNYKSYCYVVTNTRGDVLELHNGPGDLIAKYTYDAWGKLISVTNANGSALAKTNLAYQISVRYRSYVYDEETGLYYLQSRYYDPETGRFINADDAEYIGATKTNASYNIFAYCENEPVNHSDVNGKISKLQEQMAAAYLTINFNKTMAAPLKARSAYIYSQDVGYISNLIYGGYPISYNGCELIAVYNALKYLGKYMPFYKVIHYAEIHDWYLFPIVPTGVFGSTPRKAKYLFDEKKLKYTIYSSVKSKDFENNVKNGKICIATYSNKSKNPIYNLSIHTFAFYYNKKDNKYYVFNGYNTYSNSTYPYSKYAELRKGGRFFLYGIVFK